MRALPLLPGPMLSRPSWAGGLADRGSQREAALARLHGLLVRIARGEAARRGPRLAISGPELDDVACQAAADALLAITSKLGQFRGESRFTTWACKFVILEVSAKLGRHFWRHPAVPLDAEDWDRLPGRFGFDPAAEAERRDRAVRRAADDASHRGSGGSSRSRSAVALDGLGPRALSPSAATGRRSMPAGWAGRRRRGVIEPRHRVFSDECDGSVLLINSLLRRLRRGDGEDVARLR